MSQLIVKWRYMSHSSKSNIKNLVKYIAKRDGVEFTDESWRNKKVTEYQKKLIKQLIKTSLLQLIQMNINCILKSKQEVLPLI